jgi:hypothetical protein
MMEEALEILSMVIVLNLEHGHFCTVFAMLCRVA